MKSGRYIQYIRAMHSRFWAAVALFVLHAACYPLMPAAALRRSTDGSTGLLLAVGIAFWVSLLGAWALVIAANSYRRAYLRSRRTGEPTAGSRIGLLCFFSTLPGTVSDAAFAAALLALAALYLLGKLESSVTYYLLAILSASGNLHGMFNGRIYKTIQQKPSKRGNNHESD